MLIEPRTYAAKLPRLSNRLTNKIQAPFSLDISQLQASFADVVLDQPLRHRGLATPGFTFKKDRGAVQQTWGVTSREADVTGRRGTVGVLRTPPWPEGVDQQHGFARCHCRSAMWVYRNILRASLLAIHLVCALHIYSYELFLSGHAVASQLGIPVDLLRWEMANAGVANAVE